MNKSPICYIIAGPNGAGKTTFATEFLPKVAECDVFINADLIAKGLSPFNPDSESRLAGKILIEQIERYVEEKVTFAFETTMSGKAHLGRIEKIKNAGYNVVIYYIMLRDVETSIRRIEERVMKGGHHITDEDARRRFPRSVSNFLSLYSKLADEWQVFDNSLHTMISVAEGNPLGIQVFDESLFTTLKNNAKG